MNRHVTIPAPGGRIEGEYAHGALMEAWLYLRETGEAKRLEDLDLEFGSLTPYGFKTFFEQLNDKAADKGMLA